MALNSTDTTRDRTSTTLTADVERSYQRRWLWAAVLVGGVGLAGTLWRTLEVTDNPHLVPAVLLLGAAVAPVAFVTFIGSRAFDRTVTPTRLVAIGLAAGVAGVVVAGLAESLVAGWTAVAPAISTAVIEECAKIVVPVVLVLRGRYPRRGDGLLIGVAAGAGFAVLETMGYAYASATSAGGDLSSLGELLLVRGIVSPAQHMAWTGLVALGLWHVMYSRRTTAPAMQLAGWLALAIALHTLWDSSTSWAASAVLAACSLGALIVAALHMVGPLPHPDTSALEETPSKAPASMSWHRLGRAAAVVVAVVAISAAVGSVVQAAGLSLDNTAAAFNPNEHRFQEPEYNDSRTTQVVELALARVSGQVLSVDTAGSYQADGAALQSAPKLLDAFTNTGDTTTVTRRVQQWEWVPDQTGRKITDSADQAPVWGSLVSRETGKCLDVADGSVVELGKVELWSCNGGENQKWAAMPNRNGRDLVTKASYGADPDKWYTLGVNAQNCLPGGPTTAYLRQGHDNPCTTWTVAATAYSFLTNKQYAQLGAAYASRLDHATYSCMPSYHFRLHKPGDPFMDWEQFSGKDNLVTLKDYEANGSGDQITNISFLFETTGDGQAMLFCDPGRS